MNTKKILIVDDERAICDILGASLKDEGYLVETAFDGVSGLKKMHEFQPAIVLLDIWMPGELDGIEVLKRGKQESPETFFVMMSGHGTIETAVKATKLGAWDFIEKPLSMDKVILVLTHILSFQAEQEDKQALLSRLRRDISFIGTSENLKSVRSRISDLSASQSWIWIDGEAGSGRALVAQNLHFMSHRSAKAFVDVQISQIPEELQAAELFGFEPGTFPGVTQTKKGKIELASGGTLLIADLDQLTQENQNNLFDFLASGSIRRLGSSQKINVDVRILATFSESGSQNKTLSLHTGLKNEFSLNKIAIAPLRQRRDDILSLMDFFSSQIVRSGTYIRKEFSPNAIQWMLEYSWPGNVRELKNFMERVYILTPTEFVDVHDLRFAGLTISSQVSGVQDTGSFREARARFEKEFLQQKIRENEGNISRTAEVIGLERSYLHRKIKLYGLDSES